MKNCLVTFIVDEEVKVALIDSTDLHSHLSENDVIMVSRNVGVSETRNISYLHVVMEVDSMLASFEATIIKQKECNPLEDAKSTVEYNEPYTRYYSEGGGYNFNLFYKDILANHEDIRDFLDRQVERDVLYMLDGFHGLAARLISDGREDVIPVLIERAGELFQGKVSGVASMYVNGKLVGYKMTPYASGILGTYFYSKSLTQIDEPIEYTLSEPGVTPPDFRPVEGITWLASVSGAQSTFNNNQFWNPSTGVVLEFSGLNFDCVEVVVDKSPAITHGMLPFDEKIRAQITDIIKISCADGTEYVHQAYGGDGLLKTHSYTGRLGHSDNYPNASKTGKIAAGYPIILNGVDDFGAIYYVMSADVWRRTYKYDGKLTTTDFVKVV